jgi:hypothetical protein
MARTFTRRSARTLRKYARRGKLIVALAGLSVDGVSVPVAYAAWLLTVATLWLGGCVALTIERDWNFDKWEKNWVPACAGKTGMRVRRCLYAASVTYRSPGSPGLGRTLGGIIQQFRGHHEPWLTPASHVPNKNWDEPVCCRSRFARRFPADICVLRSGPWPSLDEGGLPLSVAVSDSAKELRK